MEPTTNPTSFSNQVEAVRARIEQKRRDRAQVLGNRSVQTSTGHVEARIDAAQAGVPAPYTRAQRLQNFVEQLKRSDQSAAAQPSVESTAVKKVIKKAASISRGATRPDFQSPEVQAAVRQSNQEIADAIEALDAARQKYSSLVANKKIAPEHEAGAVNNAGAPTKEQLVQSVSAAIATVLTDLKIESAVDGINPSRPDVTFAEPAEEKSAPPEVASPKISTGFAAAASVAKAASVATAAPVPTAAPVAAPNAFTVNKPNTLEVVDSEVFNVGAFIPVDVAAWDVEKFVWPMIVDQFLDVGEQAISRLANFSLDILEGSHHRLAVTSVRSGAGASTIACSIARWSAAMKKRVLLVDANIKKPSLSASIGLAPNISWVNVVRESLNPAEAVIRCKSTGVCVMPLGDTSDRQVLPQMLLDHLGGLLSSVEDSFDLIVIDTGEARYLPLELSASANLVDAAMIVDSNVASAPFRQTKENLLSFGITKFVAAQNSI